MRIAVAGLLVGLLVLCGASDAQMPPWKYGGPRNYGCIIDFATEFNHPSLNANIGIGAGEDGWNNKTIIPPVPESEITVTTIARRNYALKFKTAAYDGVSPAKSHLTKYIGPFGEGDTINSKVWIYRPADQDLGNTFWIDWECETCYPTSPGIRLYFNPAGGRLGIERGKFGLSTMYQDNPTPPPLPADRWFLVEWEMTLSVTPAGRNIVWLDGEKVIDRLGINLVNNAAIDAFVPPFEYQKVQFGLTASARDEPVYMIMDDIQVCHRIYPRSE